MCRGEPMCSPLISINSIDQKNIFMLYQRFKGSTHRLTPTEEET